LTALRKRRSARLALTVQYAVAAADLPKPAALRRWALAALTRDARLTLRFVGEAEGRTLNRRYRRRDRPTNVLAFVYHEGRGTHGIEGDVVLCVPVLRREAGEQGKLLAAHSAHLVVHAMLHLQGYDHAEAADASKMEARETAILARLGFPDPYAARSSAGRQRSRRGSR
jgi:probable rRNA maturation factor